ncbi:hypothetical protein Tcan_00997, partial [Toxocara canis]
SLPSQLICVACYVPPPSPSQKNPYVYHCVEDLVQYCFSAQCCVFQSATVKVVVGICSIEMRSEVATAASDATFLRQGREQRRQRPLKRQSSLRPPPAIRPTVKRQGGGRGSKGEERLELCYDSEVYASALRSWRQVNHDEGQVASSAKWYVHWFAGAVNEYCGIRVVAPW